MKLPALLATLLLFYSSCKKENTLTGCISPDLGNQACINDSVAMNSLVIGKWKWVQRTLNGKTSNRCTLNRTEERYFEFFDDGTLWDYLDNSCPLVGEFHITGNGRLDSWVDTFSHYKTLTGEARICNGYLVVTDPKWGTVDVYVKD